MPIVLHDWTRGLELLRDEWSDIIISQNLNPSLHPSWVDVAINAHGLSRDAFIAEVTSGQSRAIIPCVPRQITLGRVPIRCIDLFSNVMSYHAELVAIGDIPTLIREYITSGQLPKHDVIRMANITSESPTGHAISNLDFYGKRSVFRYPGERSPYIDMIPNWADYLKALPKKVRANINRCIRTTQQAGETAMKWFENGADTDELLNDILQIEALSWKAADNKAIRPDTAEGQYYRKLLPWLAKHGIAANVLYVKDRPTAYVLCARWNGWIGQLKTSFSQDVRDAGFRVIHASIERAFATGGSMYDFLGDAAPHKLRWTDKIRSHDDTWIFSDHWRGKSLALLKRTIDRWRHQRTGSTPLQETNNDP